MKTRGPRAFLWILATVWAAVALLLSPVSSTAHEIPATVTIQTYLRAEGDILRMLVRVPLGSMRDIQFPLRGPGYINIADADPFMRDAAVLWLVDYIQLFENDSLLSDVEVVATKISLPSDRSFSTFDTALAHILGPPLPETTDLVWQQAMMDVVLEYAIVSDQSRFSILSELAHLGMTTSTVLRFDLPGSDERLYQFIGNPGLIELDPSWIHAALRFVALGFFHILDGIDHLLFLFCLVIPFRRLVPLVTLVTSFTIAHSITLGASAFGYAPSVLWFPALVETLIALSIVFMALENLIGAKLRRRWLVAFGFGLVHGFGFSFALQESLQFAGAHLITSLLSFNVGVELGQIGVLLVAVPVLGLLFRYALPERAGVILLSALIAHTSWHWMAERWGTLRAYAIQLPPIDIVFLLGLTRWAIAILILVGLAWILHGVFGKIEDATGRQGSEAEAKL